MTFFGKAFKDEYPGPYNKVIKPDNKHRGIIYKEGLNIDHIPFNPTGECSEGGLYFTDRDNIANFLDYGVKLAEIEIPDDALVHVESGKFKADKFIIKSIKWYNELDKPLRELLFGKCDIVALIKEYPDLIANVELQTLDLCMIAIIQEPRTLRYIKYQTFEICFEAVKEDGNTLKYVKKQTYEICFEAVMQNSYALAYVKDKTPEICSVAVEKNSNVAKYIK